MSAQPQPEPHPGEIPLEEAVRWVSTPRADGSRVEDDEPVKPLGIDVTELAPADYEEHGIRTAPMSRIAEARSIARVWLTHSEFSTRYPKEDKVARGMARGAASWWWKRNGTLRGLTLHRTFPCLGRMRVVNEGAETVPIIVTCDVCGFTTGVRQDEFQAAMDATLA